MRAAGATSEPSRAGDSTAAAEVAAALTAMAPSEGPH